MLAVAIEDFELYKNNKNLPLGKSAIPFEPYTQKSEKSEYFVLFFYYGSQILINLKAYAQLGKT